MKKILLPVVWILWSHSFLDMIGVGVSERWEPVGGYESLQECRESGNHHAKTAKEDAERDKKAGETAGVRLRREDYFICLPDTIDPRSPSSPPSARERKQP